MLATVRSWLNGTRDYHTGVALFKVVGEAALYSQFANGKTLYNNFRLQEEMIKVCTALKEAAAEKRKLRNGNPNISKSAAASQTPKEKKGNRSVHTAPAISGVGPAQAEDPSGNPELLQACRNEADKAYKEAMNLRAVLFASLPSNKYEDFNRADLVEARVPICLQVLQLHQKASRLYDKVDYVRKHGALPDQPEAPASCDLEQLADHQVKPALDNARKACRKLEKRAKTPERLALIQSHLFNIEKLAARWHSLKQAK